MFLLRCSNCSFNNVVKNGLLTFCNNCGNKLEKNYSTWQAKHPERSLEDWYAYVYIDTESRQVNAPGQLNATDSKTKILLIIATGFLLAGGIIYFAGTKVYPKIKTAIEEARWKKLTYGTLGLYMETPEMLVPYSENLPEDAVESIQHVEYYINKTSEIININVANAQYKTQIVAHLAGSSKGILDRIKSSENISQVNYNQQPAVINGYKGLIISGSYLQAGDKIGFRTVLAAKANFLYIVMIVFPAWNISAKNNADHIGKSIAIKHNELSGF